MRKPTHLLSLGLAAVLALVGGAAVSAGAGGGDQPRPAADGQVSAAAVAPPVTMDVVPPTTTTTVPPTTTTTTTTAPPPPPPPPAPAPAPAGSVEAVIEKHFGAAAEQAKAIARCESGMNPGATSATDDHGLFQINRPSHQANFTAVTGAPWSSVYDAELNTIYARWLYGQSGWSPWTCA